MVLPCLIDRDRSNRLNRNEKDIRFFSYETLRIATNNFSTLMGRGGFGSVFKGVLSDGRLVAVKRFEGPPSLVRDGVLLELVEYMSHLRHANLIQVIGCCVEKNLLLLVTEYAEKGSLSEFLCDSTRPAFNWEKRAGVCIGTARGLSYLHEDIDPQVIHLDIKPANILLDANFNPKITDFDLARFVGRSSRLPVGGGGTGEGTIAFFRDLNAEDSVMQTSRICGTFGYMDPEYMLHGRFSKKVDVYSFGVTMLDIISGESPCVSQRCGDRRFKFLVNDAIKLRKDGRLMELVDPMLVDFPKDEVERFLNVALLCIQLPWNQRPNMFEVLLMLYGVYKSSQEISDMSMRAVTDYPSARSPQSSVSVTATDYSLTRTTMEEADTQDGGNQTGIHSTANVEEQNQLDETLPSSLQRSIVQTDASLYFQRSIQKIKEFQASSSSFATSNGTRNMAQTMVIRRVCMEAVYPPYLSGEYPPSNALCNWK